MLAAPSVLADRAPAVVTGTPADIGATAATLTGVVTPRGIATTYFFEYGSGAFDAHTPHASAGDGRAPVSVSARIEALRPETAYQVRLVAYTRHRIAMGGTVTFTTAAAPVVPATTATPAPTPAPTPAATLVPSSAPPGGAASPAALPAEPVPEPVLGERVGVVVRTGSVAIKVPGASGFATLTQGAAIPVGSLVDTRAGSVTLSSALPGDATQSGTFHGGLFEVRQRAGGDGLTELVIRGRPASCRRAAAAARKRRPPRALWGNADRGKFRTRGGNSVATVRGTIWYVEDRCDGTLTRVRRGSVVVRDLRRGRTVVVRAGHSYLAPPRR